MQATSTTSTRFGLFLARQGRVHGLAPFAQTHPPVTGSTLTLPGCLCSKTQDAQGHQGVSKPPVVHQLGAANEDAF